MNRPLYLLLALLAAAFAATTVFANAERVEQTHYDESNISNSHVLDTTYVSGNTFMDRLYIGALYGSSISTQSGSYKKGSGTAIGATIGSDIDDSVGFEIGYTNIHQGTYFGFAERQGLPPQVNNSPYNLAPSQDTDSSLTTHLVTAESQFYLGNLRSRLRPYLSAGLGWKKTILEEEPNLSTLVNQGSSSMSVSSFGALAGAGTKVRFSKNFQASIGIRYFLAFHNEDPNIEQQQALATTNGSVAGANGAAIASPNGTIFTNNDAEVVRSNFYQLFGSLQFSF